MDLARDAAAGEHDDGDATLLLHRSQPRDELVGDDAGHLVGSGEPLHAHRVVLGPAVRVDGEPLVRHAHAFRAVFFAGVFVAVFLVVVFLAVFFAVFLVAVVACRTPPSLASRSAVAA